MKFGLFLLSCLLLPNADSDAGLAFSVQALAQTAPEKTIDPAAPAELELRDLSGRSHSLQEYRGQFVVLNFWATWCAPCQDEMPLLVKASKKFASRDLIVVAVSIDDKSTLKYVPKFIKNSGMDMPVWIGGTLEDMEKLGVGPGVPSTVLIDKDGKIISRVIGQLRKNDLGTRLEWMLGDRTSPSPPPLLNNMKRSR
jgi:thiol-disulfide isomerase/thioredoxin